MIEQVKIYLLFFQFLLSKLKKFRQHRQDPLFYLGNQTSIESLASVSFFSFFAEEVLVQVNFLGALYQQPYLVCLSYLRSLTLP